MRGSSGDDCTNVDFMFGVFRDEKEMMLATPSCARNGR